ncbi:MAG: class II aldolase/adducin family protein [Spirochaetales bacterium]|nr:class II aldolase/adducin family protein [Spirochaetales bacterium]
MSKDDLKTLICRTAALLRKEGYAAAKGCLSIREGSMIYITPESVNLSELKPKDLAEVDLESGKAVNGKNPAAGLPRHIAVYRNRADINALIHSTSPSVVCSSKAGEVIRPLLDDMAQSVGTTLKTAPSGTDSKSLNRLVKALKGRNSVLLHEDGALCGSGTMDDAHAICQVSEKACQAWIESAILGGGHTINALESALMRFVYLKKYSRQAEKNK